MSLSDAAIRNTKASDYYR